MQKLPKIHPTCGNWDITVGFDTFTIEVFNNVVMSVFSLRTPIKAWHASLASLVLNQCLYWLDLRGHYKSCIRPHPLTVSTIPPVVNHLLTVFCICINCICYEKLSEHLSSYDVFFL